MRLIRKNMQFLPALVTQPDIVGFLDRDSCQQLLADYHSRKVAGVLPDDSAWTIHAAQSQKELFDTLEANDADALCALLNRIHTTHALTGYDQHVGITNTLIGEALHRNTMAKEIYVALVRLASALGVIRNFNPEQTENFDYLTEDHTDQIVQAVLDAMQIRSDFPRTAPGAFGLQTQRGILTLRHVFGLGYLREIRTTLQHAPRRYSRVVEIGGGIGRTAFHAARDFDLNYHVIDLPMVSVTAHALLMANDVPSQLWQGTAGEAPGTVCLHNAFNPPPPEDFADALFVNFDSFVEMGRDTQSAYLDMIRDAGGDLLSINHEAARIMGRVKQRQNWDIARFVDWGYDASPRSVFWERDGYLVQTFRRKGQGVSASHN